jgi:hypothetical protein
VLRALAPIVLMGAAAIACMLPPDATESADAPAPNSPADLAGDVSRPDPTAPPLALRDADGEEFDPVRSSAAVATVFVFVRSDCPISNRYAPTVRRLAEEFGPRGVAFWLVYADPDETEESIEAHREAYDFGAPSASDVHHDLVRWTGASVTPEAVVFVPGHGVVYRGRIDDRYVAFGQARQSPTRSDLLEVLERTLDGDPPAFHTAVAIGCAIRRIS